MAERQTNFEELPVFNSLELLEGAKSVISYGEVSVEKRESGMRTNVSNIEVLLPFFLDKMGLIKGHLEGKSGFLKDPSSAIMGSHLHNVDALLSLVANGSTGTLIKSVFPTYTPKECLPFEYATDKINPYDSGDLHGSMVDAVAKYDDIYLKSKMAESGQRPLFPGVKTDSIKEIEVLTDFQTKTAEMLLIDSWASEFMKSDPLTWEYRNDVLLQREVDIVLNMTNEGLQFTGRLDSIVRLDTTDKLVVSQITDFKTGKARVKTDLEKEIDLRQILMMRLMAEWFTARFLVGRKSLNTETSAFIFKKNIGNRAAERRLDQFAYRRFDKDTGTMSLEVAQINDVSRAEMERWLTWYGAMTHMYKREVRALVRNKTQFDIRNLELVKMT